MQRRLNDIRNRDQYMSPEYFLEKAKRFAEAARASLEEPDEPEDYDFSNQDFSDPPDQWSTEVPEGCYLEEVALPSVRQSYYHPDKKRYLPTPYQPPKKTNLEWFPETSPHKRTVQDPETGQYYEIVKEYDEDGVFQVKYVPLVRRRVPYGRLRYVWERDEEY